MKFRLLFVLLVLSLTWPQPLYSRTIRLAIIPLSFYSEEDLTHLRKPLMDMLVRSLKQQGFQPVPAVEAFEGEPLWVAQANQIQNELRTLFRLSFILASNERW